MRRAAPWTAFALLALAACGGDDRPAPPTVAAAVAPPQPSTTPPKAAPVVAPPELPSPPKPEREVVVRVLDWHDEPVVGAKVAVISYEGDPSVRTIVASATTDAAGHARFADADLMGDRAFEVEAPLEREDLVSPSPAKASQRSITLNRGYTVRGVVHDDRGDGAAGAVWLRSAGPPALGEEKNSWREARLLPGAKAAPNGTFAIRGVRYGPVELQATAPSEEGPSRLPFAPWTLAGAGDAPVVLERQRTTDAAMHPDAGFDDGAPPPEIWHK